jgi:hypothetical protein
MNDPNNPLHRAARLVVAAHFRYLGVVPHQSSCVRLPFMDNDCNCGASHLNESLEILKDTLKASGEPLWSPTSEELSTEMTVLLDKHQTEEKCLTCHGTKIIRVNLPNFGEVQCPVCSGKVRVTPDSLTLPEGLGLLDWCRARPEIPESMSYRNAHWAQACFVRDFLPCAWGIDEDERQAHTRGDATRVIGVHCSKSIYLPVYGIDIPRLGVRAVLRNNFYDWNVSIDSLHPCPSPGRLFSEDNIDYCFFQGFPPEWCFKSYQENPKRFSFYVNGNYSLYAYFTLLARNIEELQNKKCSVCQSTGVIKVNHCTDCGCADVGVGVIHHPACGEEQCPSCGGKSGTTL